MDIEKYLEILLQNSLFKNFSYQELLSLFNNNIVKKYKKNSIIHFESEKCTTLDIILDGEILVQRIDENGNVLTITQLFKSDIMGENLLFSNNNFYPMSIFAKNDTLILHLQRNFILDLCQNNKTFLIEFLNCMSDKTLILTNKIKSISMKSLQQSIIDFLDYEYYNQKSTEIVLNMTKKELAERFGVQRTSLSRELNKMKSNGLITYDKDKITIIDLNILKNNVNH